MANLSKLFAMLHAPITGSPAQRPRCWLLAPCNEYRSLVEICRKRRRTEWIRAVLLVREPCGRHRCGAVWLTAKVAIIRAELLARGHSRALRGANWAWRQRRKLQHVTPPSGAAEVGQIQHGSVHRIRLREHRRRLRGLLRQPERRDRRPKLFGQLGEITHRR